VMRRVHGNRPGLYLEHGGHLIGLESSDDVVLEILDDCTDFGMD